MDQKDILNLAHNITRQSIGISTQAEMMTLPPKEDTIARCRAIIQSANDILDIYKELESDW